MCSLFKSGLLHKLYLRIFNSPNECTVTSFSSGRHITGKNQRVRRRLSKSEGNSFKSIICYSLLAKDMRSCQEFVKNSETETHRVDETKQSKVELYEGCYSRKNNKRWRDFSIMGLFSDRSTGHKCSAFKTITRTRYCHIVFNMMRNVGKQLQGHKELKRLHEMLSDFKQCWWDVQ